ncbi:hypothetical protein GGX14DRAFT_352350 [Mycena pura]|uniref:Uncharacterized protein n=1 Tax=Mycena pura TaxID=153505 RepID=A0AAD6YLP9_9AGAR|nr:hypothetical protein GGX14DRAFT_352350 [Mycena pura]
MSSFSADVLAFVARGLHESNGKEERNTATTTLTGVLKRQARILDALAYISVSFAEKHVVAVGMQTFPEKTVIYVAENGRLDPKILDYLKDLFRRLQILHERRPNQQRSQLVPDYVHSRTTDPFEQELVHFEQKILQFCWNKQKKRLTKNARATNFMDIVGEVCGTPAVQRTDLSKSETECLAGLQAPPDFDRGQLEKLGRTIGKMVTTLARAPSSTGALQLRIFLTTIADICENFSQKVEFVLLWNRYTQRKTTIKTVSKAPDVMHWLSKVTAIREHCLRLADVATSTTLSAFLLKNNFEVKAVSNPVQQMSHSPSLQTLKSILVAAGCDMDEDPESTAELLEMLAKVHSSSLDDGGNLVTQAPTPIHCECILLSCLHGQSYVPYIGVSKLSCGFCSDYFAAYREATASSVCTRGTHGQTASWRCPPLDAELNAKLNPRLSSKILTRIKKGWEQRRPSLLSSQSTDASGEGGRTRAAGMCRVFGLSD